LPAQRRGARKPTSRRTTSRPESTHRPALTADRPTIVVKPESLDDFNESVNILIHGNSGVGKTVLASGAPNAYFLTTEKGVVSAKRAGSSAQIIRAPDWWHVEAGLDWADNELTPEDWLLVDSGTKMQVLLIRHLLQLENQANEARDLDVPQIQDHQKWQNMYMRFIDRMVEAQYNMIFITTSMHKEDPEGESLVLPQITGKDYAVSNYVCAAMDMVMYYGVARQSDKNAPTVRRILAETYPPYFAKDRYNVLPRWTDVEDGDYGIMADIIADVLEVPEDDRKAAKAADVA
jgi:hypothetical protein